MELRKFCYYISMFGLPVYLSVPTVPIAFFPIWCNNLVAWDGLLGLKAEIIGSTAPNAYLPTLGIYPLQTSKCMI